MNDAIYAFWMIMAIILAIGVGTAIVGLLIAFVAWVWARVMKKIDSL